MGTSGARFDSYLGTGDGVAVLTGGGVAPLGLEGKRVSAIHAWRAASGDVTILAGTYEDGLFRSTDGGRGWTPVADGLTAPCFRTLGPDPHDARAILAGTEPGRAFRSHDGGASWQELDGIRELPHYDAWYLPYSPRAGALRNFYAPPGGGQRLLASIEVGGLLDSPDNGATWRYLPIPPDYDVHHITGDPADANTLYASLGYAGPPKGMGDATQAEVVDGRRYGGIARTRDGGQTWTRLERDYTRATLVPSARPELLLAGPAPEVGRQGRIVVSANGGDDWQPAGGALAQPMDDMVELFVEAPDQTIWAITSGGRLLCADPGDWQWRAPHAEVARREVEAVAFVGV
jgi:photosystem II stability/assembly factor-like uncharacterized protein